jgi:hypothetical protein
MSKRNRLTLKSYFQKGQMPSEEHFCDLIDSMHNIEEDGDIKSLDEDGLMLTPNKQKQAISIYENKESFTKDNCLWNIGLKGEANNLLISSGDGKEFLEFNNDTESKKDNTQQSDLKINGNIQYNGRIGGESKLILANGKWHNILTVPNGCYMYEIIAGARGDKKSGKFALINAIAVSTYNSNNKIKTTQAYYGSYFNKIKLRWRQENNNLHLQIKTRCDFGEGQLINTQITKLWHDAHMQSCTSK